MLPLIEALVKTFSSLKLKKKSRKNKKHKGQKKEPCEALFLKDPCLLCDMPLF